MSARVTAERPAPGPAVARPTDIAQVLELVASAAREGRRIALRDAGADAYPGELVLDLAALDAVAVNSHIGTVRAHAGATWGDVDRATRPSGLTVPAAARAEGGVRGRTLAEDEGACTRPFGPDAESLLEVALVTPDDGLIVANAYHNAELLAAIRAGHELPGVAVSFLFQARETSGVRGHTSASNEGRRRR